MAQSAHGIRITNNNGDTHEIPSVTEVQDALHKILHGWSSTAAGEANKEASIAGITLPPD